VSLRHPLFVGVRLTDIISGTKNLRVADLSIAPLHIAAHTCDTAYAIGEKVISHL
jgi:hypothetical protein